MRLVWSLFLEYEQKVIESLGESAAFTTTEQVANTALGLTQHTIAAMTLPVDSIK